MDPTTGADVELPDELTLATWRRTVAQVAAALDAAHDRIVLECSALERFDDEGIAFLLGLAEHGAKRSLRVVLRNPTTALRSRLELGGLAWLFEWWPVWPDAGVGTAEPMPDHDARATEPAPDAVERRANLLPEEQAAGSDDPQRQAAAILEESEARILAGNDEAARVERRTSQDTVEPPEPS